VLGDPSCFENSSESSHNALKYNRPLGWIEVSTRYETANRFSKLRTAHDLSSEDLDDYCSPFDVRDKRAWVPARFGIIHHHNIVRAHGGRLTLHALLDGG